MAGLLFSYINCVVSVPGMVFPGAEKLSEIPQIHGYVFVLFLLCFMITSVFFGKNSKMLLSMVNELVHVKARHSIFYVEIGNELYSKILLCLQSSILLSLFLYCVFNHQASPSIDTLSSAFLVIGLFVLLFVIYFTYKWLMYRLIGWTFFTKDQMAQWMSNFVSLVGFLGILLFVPVLLMFYMDFLYIYCYYFVLFCIFLVIVTIIYKTYVLFFHDNSLFLYLFLYLCGQEILPLFLLYKGLIYLFNIVENNALWLQI